jgi:hypothetical protein
MKREDLLAMKAIALCFKPYLKPEEAMIYCNLQHTALAERLNAFGIYKNASGYFKRSDLDHMMSGSVGGLPLRASATQSSEKSVKRG